MKKILFVCNSLKVGGIERALVEQVNYLAKRGYNVTLFLFTINGPYLEDVDKRVKVIGNLSIFKYLSLTQLAAKKKGMLPYLTRSFFAVAVKLIGFPYLWKILKPFIPNIGKYDIAIAYTLNVSLKSLYCGCPEFVLDKVNSTKKIAWMHADYKRSKISCTYNDSLYTRFHMVVNVTECMKTKFDTLKLIPKEKSIVIYNRFAPELIIKKSLSFDVTYNHNVMNIISVGRLEQEKGSDRLLYIAKKLHDRHVKFCWYFIGTGVLNNWCEDYVERNNLNECVVLLGQQNNPYPYIKHGDIFVSGSLSETFGLSILEALVLGTPSIAYRFDAIDEILNESNGYVANSFDELCQVIENVIGNASLYAQLKNKTHVLFDYNLKNATQIETILK